MLVLYLFCQNDEFLLFGNVLFIESDLLNRLTLSGYVDDKKVVKSVNGTDYEIHYFQGEHSKEYLIVETKNGVYHGKAQLFDNGIITMSYMYENGIQKGHVTTYKNGIVEATRSWASLFVTDLEDRCIENRKTGLLMVIRDRDTDQIIYEGSYGDGMLKNGYGFEFDNQTGKRIRYGIFEDDEMVQLLCDFKDDQMTEYYVKDNESNIHLYQRHPVYVGGFLFIEEQQCVVRHGDGVIINHLSGMAEYVGVWVNGAMVNGFPVYDGWYQESLPEASLKLIADEELRLYEESVIASEAISAIEKKEEEELTQKEELSQKEEENLAVELMDVVIQSPSDLESLNTAVSVLIVPDNTCNKKISTLEICSMPVLKIIQIGENCFKGVTKVKIKKNQELESFLVGNKSFTRYEDEIEECKSYSLTISHNPMLSKIVIGQLAFAEYYKFVLEGKE